MKNGLIFLICLFPLLLSAKKKEISVAPGQRLIATNISTGSDIKVNTLCFSDRVFKVNVDKNTGWLTVQLRGLKPNGKYLKNKGAVLLYAPKEANIKWSRHISFMNSSVKQFNDDIIFRKGSKRYFIDNNTGKEKSRLQHELYYYDQCTDIALGYKYDNEGYLGDNLEAMDLNSRRILWSKVLSKKYGWDAFTHLNDSTVIITSSGLHCMNLRSGKGWKLKSVTAIKNYTSMIGANIAGIAAGVLTGTAVISTGQDVLTGLASQVLIDSSFLYFASQDKLCKLNKSTGEVIWTYPFEKKFASNSRLYINDSTVFMINNGKGFIGRGVYNCGKVFIAAFDKKTGDARYVKEVAIKKNPVVCSKDLRNFFVLVFKDRLMKFSKKTGEMILDKNLSSYDFGNMKYFVGDNIYMPDGAAGFKKMKNANIDEMFVFTTNGLVLNVNSDLDVVSSLYSKNLFYSFLEYENCKMLTNRDESYLIDESGKKHLSINISPAAFIVNDVLYDKLGNDLIMVEMSELLKN